MKRTIGPVEMMVIGFAENRFTGAIAPNFLDLVDRGIVRIIDMSVVVKDAADDTTILELHEYSSELAEALQKLTGEVPGLLSEEDLFNIADMLEPDSTVAILLFEHVWATSFAQAVRDAGGQLIASQRIPHDMVEETREMLIAAAGQGE